MTFSEWVLREGHNPLTSEEYDIGSEAWERSKQEAVFAVLKAIAGTSWKDSPFKGFIVTATREVVDRMNDNLSGFDWYFVVCADGLAVFSSSQPPHNDLAKKVFEAM
jgi:hypothetical protein